METQTFLIRCEYPDGDHIPTQEFVENIQEYFAANIMDGERGRLVVKPVYQPKEEGLVEEETVHNKWTGLKVELELSDTVIGVSNVESLQGERFMSGFVKAIIPPSGYIFKDENGNVINATKIVLEKKKKEYPKTYEECCEILGMDSTINHVVGTHFRYRDRIRSFIKLLICRDAYWKIAGEELGLGKPWKPDWSDYENIKYIVGGYDGEIGYDQNHLFIKSLLSQPQKCEMHSRRTLTQVLKFVRSCCNMMTDLDFYTKALRLQSLVLKQVAQIKAYNEHWDAKYCKQKVTEWLNTFADNNDVKEVFAIENLTQERAETIGFCYWDKDEFPNLMLFPLWYCFLLPYGTKVIDIWGQETIYNEKINLDVRFGCVAFGINIEK